MNIIDELKWRGAVNQQTDEEVYTSWWERNRSLSTAGSIDGGQHAHRHLIPFMILKRFQLAGHHPVIVIGGGTAPSAIRPAVRRSVCSSRRSRSSTMRNV